MFFKDNDQFDEAADTQDERDQTKPSANPSIREDGSYELVFGSENSDPTSYSANGFNAYGFSANGSRSPEAKSKKPKQHPKKARKQVPPITVSIVILIIAVALLVLSIVLSALAYAKLNENGTHALVGTKPESTDPIDPWINPAELATPDAFANVTAKVIDSVVTITADASSGSGIVWASGDSITYILTCNHVIEDAAEIEIELYNGTTYYAEVVGTDSRSDIAILRIAANGLSGIVLPSEESALAIGQSVIAIGNPLGTLGHSVTNGILSSVSRRVSIDGAVMELIQTNAAVNHGNSGGGLFDMNGQLIGLVNAKISESSVENIGFAIPYTTLRVIAEELIEQGYVSGRPTLGIESVTLDESNYLDILEAYPDLEAYAITKDFFGRKYYTAGVYILNVNESTKYAEGSEEFAFGDRFMAIGTTAISDSSDLSSALNAYSPGETVQITVARKSKTVVIELILGEIGQ